MSHDPKLAFLKPATPQPVEQHVGEVMSVEAEECAVRVAGQMRVAKRAVSCLVAPEVGDQVLVAVSEPSFVLAVLEREHDAVAISVPGDVRLEVPAGRFSVTAREGVDVISGEGLAMTAETMQLNAREGGMFFEALTYAGRFLNADLREVKTAIDTVDQVIGRVSERLKNAYRFVEGLDRQQAGHLNIRAEKSAQVRAENTIVSAEELVKLDGDQIHLG